jgi:acyl carrier protein
MQHQHSDASSHGQEPTAPERAAYAPPETDIEKKVAALWADVVKLDRVGIDDHFLEIGGQSLQAVLLLSHIHEMFGVEVQFKEFLDAPTVRKLSEHIEAALQARGSGVGAESEATEEGVI